MGWCADVPAFRLVAPKATYVEIVFRDHPAGTRQETRSMTATSVGERAFWHWRGTPPLPCYRYRVHLVDRTLNLADPWSATVARQKGPRGDAWSVALQEPAPFDWQGCEAVEVPADRAVILELHVGDQTAHTSAGSAHPGTLLGLRQSLDDAVGLGHARALGINAIELLPMTSWPINEGDRSNHWGYMPSFFCAVTERYGERWSAAARGDWPDFDGDGRYVDPGVALKELIRACHRAGMGVLLDVVYNHVSMHDRNPLLHLDPGGWFHHSDSGHLRAISGCGNDLDSRHPEMRSLILHSVRRWLAEYRFDGLRLDLAELLDDETLRGIVAVAEQERPDALLIAEPWSFGGHRPAAIAALGYSVWNDRCRHAIKGREPGSGHGFALGRAPDDNGEWRDEMRVVLAGCAQAVGGHLPGAAHSLNYVESHDDRTLGDFLRLALAEVRADEIIERAAVARLSERALAVHKLIAALLLASRGPVMLSQGQTWGRAKVATGPADPPGQGKLCANSWDRTDETNHLDWRQRDLNRELVQWYRALIDWRCNDLVPAWAAGGEQRFVRGDNVLSLGYTVHAAGRTHAVLFNADPTADARLPLPAGQWRVLLGEATVQDGQGIVLLPACSAAILQLD